MADPTESELVAIEQPQAAPLQRPVPPGVVFALVAVLCAISLGAPLVLFARSALTSAVPEITTSPVPASTGARTPSPAPVAVRVLSSSGSAELISPGVYRVTFTWMLEGAREGDAASIRFSIGSSSQPEQRGNLDPSVFTQTTGELRLVTSQNCSAEGWSAELVSVRGAPIQGERVARAAGVACGS